MAAVYNPSAQYEVKSWDVEYQQDPVRTLIARIYQPQGSDHFPVLLDVHGGAWNDQDRTANALVDQQLAASGVHRPTPGQRSPLPGLGGRHQFWHPLA